MSRFDYDFMVQQSLLNVVRNALLEVQEKGFMGAHHFYISFQTNRPDVKLSDTLRNKYLEEITIVLQHQFWDLKVTDKGFAVTLSFNDQQETIEAPYSALISFLDPSVKFGLQFMPEEYESTFPTDSEPKAQGENNSKSNVISIDSFRKKD